MPCGWRTNVRGHCGTTYPFLIFYVYCSHIIPLSFLVWDFFKSPISGFLSMDHFSESWLSAPTNGPSNSNSPPSSKHEQACMPIMEP
ncbi:hypothetical protein M407DRAFT_244570 [Tulasnella calospora MUT 4182]|uniref:Uncharacterized protein n=1 Tax=Tulasnella calospora MUT 4182 TaxID=1051891 RepID=A0A0C3KRJ6_9AGAM|nr:hypothetical protein M407DRAFT_244570 [Tulasnella calospora MUT 4182]